MNNAKGERLYKRLEVRFHSALGAMKRRTFVAPPGKYYTEENILDQLDLIVDMLEQKFPEIKWRMVEIAPNHYNFVGDERKDTPE